MGFVDLQTAIPGPQSIEWMERYRASVCQGAYNVTPVFIKRGEGAVIEDVDGNQLLDFAGGLGCLAVGHCFPPVVEAIQAQTSRYLHGCVHVTPYEEYVLVAEALNRRAPGDIPKRTLLANSGAEAIENAIKIARCYTKKSGIICFEDAFHGRTLLALSLTSKTQPYKAGFGPYAPEIYRLPYAYCYRCSYSLTYPECELHCARQIENLLKRYVAVDSVAAVVVEPVLGEGGFVVPPNGFFETLTRICRRHGILVIADEIQTGIGRTGSLFASEQLGLEPDILTTAKSLGGGLPLAAVTGREEIMQSPVMGGLGGTFGGNPVACRAALAVLDTIENQSLMKRALQIGETFRNTLEGWRGEIQGIGDIRGMGAMQAIELVRDRSTRQPATEETRAVIRACYERGLIVLSAGTYGNVIRVLVPLVATQDQIREGLLILKRGLESAFSAAAAEPAGFPSPTS